MGLEWIWQECGLHKNFSNLIGFIDNLEVWGVMIDTAKLRHIDGVVDPFDGTLHRGTVFYQGLFQYPRSL